MKISLATIILAGIPLLSFAQATQEQQVMLPVNRLFQGMKAGDSAMVHSTFTKDITLVSMSRDKSGNPVLRNDPAIGFLKAIGTPHTDVYSEMIWGTNFRVDGDFAQVWTSYAFYVGKKFSHCGVDAFHLFKGADGNWKIFHLADTRQREGCTVPPSISDQFK